MCHRVQGDSVAKRQPLLCVVGVVTSCVCLALMFVHQAHVQLRIFTLLLAWKRCSSSQSSPFSVIRIISTEFSVGCGRSSPTLHLVRHVLHLVRHVSSLLYALSQSVLFTQMLICFFHRETDHFRMLSRLSLDFTLIVETTLYFRRQHVL